MIRFRIPEYVRGLVPAMRIYKRLMPYMKGEYWKLGLAFLAMLGACVTTLAAPVPIALVFDGVLFNKRASGLREAIKRMDIEQGTVFALSVLMGAYLFIVALDALLEYARELLASSAAQRAVYRIRRAAFANLLRQPPGFFQKQRGGDLLLRITGDVSMLRDLLVPSVLDAVQQTVVLCGMFIVIGLVSWKLALVSVAIVPPLGVAFIRGGRKLTEVSREQRKREGRLAAWATQAFQAIGVVQAFGREESASEQFGTSNRKSLKAAMRATKLEARIGRTVDFLTGAGTCAVLMVGAIEVRGLRLTAGELLIVMTYLRQVYKPLRTFGKLASRSAKAAACGERVMEVLSLESPIVDSPVAEHVDRLTGKIEFEHVSVDYGDGQPALNDVSLTIRPGERVALIGASGAGKSTFLSLIPRLCDPTSGRILIDGTDIRSIRLMDLRRNIAVAFQEPGLLGETVRENIAFGLEGVNDDAIHAAARKSGVDAIVRTRREGLDAPVAERGASLSGGERQRISLARMALRDAPIVLLDEPFSALDPERQAALEETLYGILQGKTAIVVTHKLDRLDLFDRVVLFAGGKIIADGKPHILAKTSPAYCSAVAASNRSPRPDAAPMTEAELEESGL